MFCRSSSIRIVLLTVSFNGLVHCASSTKDLDWWYPAAGFAREYDKDEDVVIESVRERIEGSISVPFRGLVKALSPRKRTPAERMILLSEDSYETRIHGDQSEHTNSVGKRLITASSNAKLGVGTIVTGTVESTSFAEGVSQVGGNQSSVMQGTGLGSSVGQGSSVVTATAVGSKDTNLVNDTIASNATEANAAQASGQNGAAAKQPLATKTWFSFLRFTFSFAFVVKALCMMCNIFYQASPLPLISEISTKGDTGDSDLAPFIATAYGGWQWCFYGLFAYIVTQKSGFLVLVYSNVVGATLGLYYVYTFNANCKNTAMLQKAPKYYLVLGSLVLVQFITIATLKPVSALFFSGFISSVWSTIGSLALISTVSTVYETQSSKTLPVPLLVMGEISAVLWIVCGVVLWDPWITFPNAFALIVCTFALHLCHKYPAHAEPAEEETHETDVNRSLYVDPNEDCSDRASPLQRALAFVSRSGSHDELLPLQDQHVATTKQYGSAPSTGGTGESF